MTDLDSKEAGIQVKRFAKASSTRAVGGDSGQASLRRTLAVLALSIAALFATAASASASSLGAITNVSYASVHIKGKVSASGLFTSWAFEYSTDENTWSLGPAEYIFNGSGEVPVNADLTGLKGGTKYFVRLAVNGIPTAPPYPEFTTLAVEPPTVVATDNPSPIFSTSATATGKVKRPANSDPAFDVNCRFEYVTQAQFTATNFAGAAQAPCKENPITAASVDAGGEMSVSAELGGANPPLTAATTYHLRLAAENASTTVVTKEAASTFTTAAKVAKPAVFTSNNAINIRVHGARATGSVQRPAGQDPALDVRCHFEYVTDEQFKATAFASASTVPCQLEHDPITSAGPGYPAVTAEVGADFGGLTEQTTYHLRLVAENDGGTDIKEAASTFTTLQLNLPILTMDQPNVEYTTAEVSGTLNPRGGYGENGNFLEWYFQYSTEPGNPDSWVNSNVGFGDFPEQTSPFPFGGTIEGLKPETTYFFRVKATGAFGEPTAFSPQPYPEATTKAVPLPAVTFNPVTNITKSTAHFSGSVNPNAPAGPLNAFAKAAFKTDWSIKCSPDCPAALEGVVEGEEGSQAISLDPIRLETNTFYELTLSATNVGGTTIATQSFQTPFILPEVSASPGGSAGKGSFNIGGLVTPYNSKITDCHFEYGPTTEYVYRAPCSPNPVGRSEVQHINVGGGSTELFTLSFRGQTTGVMTPCATAALVESELEALSTIGPEGISKVDGPVVNSSGELTGCGAVDQYEVHFGGPLASQNLGLLKGDQDGPPREGEDTPVLVYTTVEGGNNAPVLVETHLTGLTPGASYHYQLFATNSLGTIGSGDQTFATPLAADEAACPNEAARTEDSSTALPECRAYELTTNSFKTSSNATLGGFYSQNEETRVLYATTATNVANSGQGSAHEPNQYVARRTENGWETIPNLNGPRGTLYVPPEGAESLIVVSARSTDLLSSLYYFGKFNEKGNLQPYLRRPDGSFASIGIGYGFETEASFVGASADISHLLFGVRPFGDPYGHGVYEFIGTGNGLPTRVDVGNDGTPISDCSNVFGANAVFASVSADGNVVWFSAVGPEGGQGQCKLSHQEIWARVSEEKSYDASTSQCTRTVGDPGGACNAPSDATFEGATSDGSRVFFTTKQQLVNGDTDQTNDLYAYDLPTASNPNPPLIDVSGSSSSEADVQRVLNYSKEGNVSRVYFTAEGVLAGNHDALDEAARAGDMNVYVWQQDSSRPEGETKFIGRLTSSFDESYLQTYTRATSDGRYLVFRPYSQFVPTDTDNAADVYRYDAVTGELSRVSVDAAGVSGNTDGLDAEMTASTISNNGEEIIFTTTEALSPNDGNGALDIYIWKEGRTALISTGSVGGGAGTGSIDGSGENIFFTTSQELTPDDIDNVTDVYDARVDGGFRFIEKAPCSGEGCQPSLSAGTNVPATATEGAGGGNHQRGTVSVAALSSLERESLGAGGEVSLRVKVSGPGKISVNGTARIGGKPKQVFKAKLTAVQAGEVMAPISLSQAAQSRLQRAGSLTIHLTANFADALPDTSTLTLKKSSARLRHSKRRGG